LLPPLESAAVQLEAVARIETRRYGVHTETVTALGDPVAELLRWSESATLLAVGTRGTGRVAAALLGSHSANILHRTVCPTAVVPAAARS
jgi:nucleotide-binding universal stress UspA family protein